MCGIAGILKIHAPEDGPPPQPLEAIPEAWLDTLDDSILHRGPDGEGRFRDRAVRDDGKVVDVAFVHRRLSIIDHEGGHQPMVHDGERLRPDLVYKRGEQPILAHEAAPGLPLVAVVFNGCIYNHRELRQELESHGLSFETDHSDTEVLVLGWRQWAMVMQDHLDAMYSGLIWERWTGQVASLADNAGEKPLYENEHALDDSHYRAWCSSAAGVLKHQAPAAPLAEQFETWLTRGLERWICAGSDFVPAAAIFNCTRSWSITPSHPLQGAKEPRRRSGSPIQSATSRWRHRYERGAGDGFSDPHDVERALDSAVTSRLEADVPLGVFLSGGIDSALISALAHRARPDIKAFTVRMPHTKGRPRFDESEAAAETARHIGIEHHVLDCAPNPSADLVHLIQQLGLPFGDSSLLPTYWVSKAAREQASVALSGDGADELFGGYRRHTIKPLLQSKWKHLLKLIPDRILDRRTPASRSEYAARLAVAAHHAGYGEVQAIFASPDFLRLVPRDANGDPNEPVCGYTNSDALLDDFESYLPNDILRKTDTASMAVGLEVRAPFLAKDLVEFAMRTPLDVLMPSGERKGLLKQVARKHLPDSIVDRPKQGFAIPIGEWFRTDFGGMRQLLHDHLDSADPFPGLAEAGVNIDMGFVRQMQREHDVAGERSINPWLGRDHSQRLYMLLVLSIWAKWLQGIRGEHSPVNRASA